MLAVAVPFVDALIFFASAAICVIGALGVINSRNTVHSALNLVLTLFGIAVLFLQLYADFLAAVQVIVYAGAIVVLFLFVIMLLGVDREEDFEEPLVGQRLFGILAGLAFLVMITAIIFSHPSLGARSTTGGASKYESGIAALSQATFVDYLIAFELTSALLIIAIVGAVALVKRKGQIGSDPGPKQELEGSA